MSHEARIEELLARMTLAQKVGQMTQSERLHITPDEVRDFHIGSVLSGGGSTPGDNRLMDWVEMNDAYWAASMEESEQHLAIPVLYGVDAIHGHNNASGATIFPHNIGLGCANDPELMERIGRVTAMEILATGVEWTFAPTLAVARDDRWGRTYESWSEDPERVAALAPAFVRGLQGDLGDGGVVACLKHWVGDGGTEGGVDQGETTVSEEELRRLHIAPYVPALEAGALTVMASYNSWNGEKCHGHPYLLTEVLKKELGFDGLVVTDWNGINQLSKDYGQAVELGVNAGSDLFMVPEEWRRFIEVLTEAVESGRVPMARIDDAVRRILRVKLRYGLFHRPRPAERPHSASEAFGSDAHRAVAREAVRKSLVLLQNHGGVLPVSKDARVLVAGRNADSRGHLCGGFTVLWQGSHGNELIEGGTSIWEGIRSEAPAAVLSPDASVLDQDGEADFEVAIVVIGEDPYAEGFGDVRVDGQVALGSGLPNPGAQPNLQPYAATLEHRLNRPEDLAVLEKIRARGIPIVTVLVSGRPLVVEAELAASDAFVAAWLPGSEGAGVSDVLFGHFDFQGTLAFSWPRSDTHRYNRGDPEYDPRFSYGFGLTQREKNHDYESFDGRIALTAVILFGLAGCDRDLSLLDPAPFPSDAEVFSDALGPGLGWFQPFAGSKLDAFQFDESVAFTGSGSVRVDVPGPGDPTGGYAGGALVAEVPRDLSGYNALTFWARGSTSFILNTVGLGNNNTGLSLYTAEVANSFRITGSWLKYTIPIPDASKLTREDGILFLAEGSETGSAYSFWMDEIKFETLSTLANPRASIPTSAVNGEVGAELSVAGGTYTVDVGGVDITVATASAYFDFTSSDPAVAQATDVGTVQLVGPGEATITASLGGVSADGQLTLSVTAPPAVAPPTPDEPAEEVVSLFSDAYDDVVVDTWSADWDQADVEDVQIGGDNVKKYTNMVFAGIEFTSAPVDASQRTMLHMDVWAATADLRVKLVDFGADGVFGGGDDSEFEITLNAASDPAIQVNTWNSLDIPMSAFAGLTGRGHLAQMIVSSASPTVYLDNIYFHGTLPMEPTAPAPTPTQPAGSVVSMYSNAYTDVTVDTWSADWDDADLEDVVIAGDDMKKYTSLVFAGIEATSAPIDASAMTRFRMDIWTPDDVATGSFRVKLVDFGANGTFQGGDDTEFELTFTAATDPALATGSWVSIDVPLTDFTGMNTGAIAQMIIAGDPNTVFVDNVYFYGPPPSEPTAAAPTPSHQAGDVVSMYSNAYTDVTVDTWSAGWDDADVADVVIAGDDMKKYTSLVFAGIEAGSAPIDASAMTHFHMDIWTPDDVTTAAFRVKLVDFGANGSFQGGDDTEFELTFTAATDPALATGSWVAIDVPLTAFTGMNTGAIAQMIIGGDPNTVFVDNVYFYNDVGGAPARVASSEPGSKD